MQKKLDVKKVVLLALLLPFSFTAFAQLKASVNDLAFMAGTWTQHHEWGDMEEFWGPPMGDNIVCSYRCVKNGKIVFYEFMTIEQTGEKPILFVRHFNKGSIGWEDKDKPYQMPLISLKENEATFESLNKNVNMVYRRLSPTKMDIILNEKGKDGNWKQDIFNYTLKK